MKCAWLLALVALAACSKAGPAANSAAPANAAVNAATAAPAAASGKLAKIFSADMLGANVAFLETITGPAFKTEGPDRIYKVDGCTVIVGATAGKIDNLGVIGYSDACSFDIAQYFAGGYDYPVPRSPTFGDIKKGLGGDYTADCLHLCGNAAAPVVALQYTGSHADNFNDLVASVSVVEDPVLAAYDDWGGKLVAKYGEDYVDSGKFNGGDNLDDVVSADFAHIRPTTVRVGQNLIKPA